MNVIPSYLTSDETYFYVTKEHIDDIKEYEHFIPLDDLLDNTDVTSAYYNCLGTLYGRLVIVI